VKRLTNLELQLKMLTRQDGFEPSTELTSHGRENDVENAPLILNLSVDQCRSGKYTLEIEV